MCRRQARHGENATTQNQCTERLSMKRIHGFSPHKIDRRHPADARMTGIGIHRLRTNILNCNPFGIFRAFPRSLTYSRCRDQRHAACRDTPIDTTQEERVMKAPIGYMSVTALAVLLAGCGTSTANTSGPPQTAETQITVAASARTQPVSGETESAVIALGDRASGASLIAATQK